MAERELGPAKRILIMMRKRYLRLLLFVALAPALALAGSGKRSPGFVDGTEFIDIAGDESVTVEVSIQGALLKALTGIDPELAKLAGGLESIHAVILQLDDKDVAKRVADMMRQTERGLLKRNWERLAIVKDHGSEVRVLVLNDEETIQGLVVMVADTEEDQMVFANISGVIDLAAISRLGESLDIPGLDKLNLEEGDDDDE